jgi:hypothetical protein
MEKGWELLLQFWVILISGYLFILLTTHNWNRWSRTIMLPIPLPFSEVMAILSGSITIIGLLMVLLIPIGLALENYSLSWILFILYIIIGAILIIYKSSKIKKFKKKLNKYIYLILCYSLLISGIISLTVFMLVKLYIIKLSNIFPT